MDIHKPMLLSEAVRDSFLNALPGKDTAVTTAAMADIKKIVVVGAVAASEDAHAYNNAEAKTRIVTELKPVDSDRLTQLLQGLAANGIMIADDVEIRLVNPVHEGRLYGDYTAMNPPPACDLLIISYIWDPKKPESIEQAVRNFLKLSPYPKRVTEGIAKRGGDKGFYAISPTQRANIFIWGEQAAKSGAKLVVAFWNANEISAQQIAAQTYHTGPTTGDYINYFAIPSRRTLFLTDGERPQATIAVEEEFMNKLRRREDRHGRPYLLFAS